jgi:hypothetical protein
MGNRRYLADFNSRLLEEDGRGSRLMENAIARSAVARRDGVEAQQRAGSLYA